MARKVRVLLNRHSGDTSCAASRVTELFAGCGTECEVVELTRGSNAGAMARGALSEPEIDVVAAGGDGTVNAVANALAGTGRTMGVLPVGTLNHFAKDLGIPLELKAAVETVCGQRAVEVDAGEVNGLLFVNNSSLGFYPAMATQRERMRRVGWNKWLSLLLASLLAFARFRHIRVRLIVDGKERTCTTPFLFVGNNEYRMEAAHVGTREHLNRGKLFLYLAPGANRLDILRITLAALRGRVHDERGFEEFCVTEFTVDTRRRRTRVALDGEVRRLKGPLHYRIRPAALRVLCPAKDEIA